MAIDTDISKRRVVKKKKAPVEEVPEEIVPKTKNNTGLVWVLVIGVLIALIFFGMLWYGNYKIEQERTKYEYNNYPFFYDENTQLYTTVLEINKVPYNVPFFHHPSELEDILVDVGVESLVYEMGDFGQIIITLDPDLSSTAVKAGIQISRVTGDRFNIFEIPTGSALTGIPDDFVFNETNATNNNTNSGLPFNIVTCDDAFEEQVVIHLTLGSPNHIKYEGYCITLQAENEDELVRLAERLDYALLGIMRTVE